ncbi:MAG: glycosyltransferase [Candidatus Saccharimonadales bacterium]
MTSEKNPIISIITPVYNSAHLLPAYFDALLKSEFKDFEVIINDDLRSTDTTARVVQDYKEKGLNITYLKENKSMAQGRKRASLEASGKLYIHLDSDMQVTTGLLGECAKLSEQYDALVIPEESYGTTLWAKCKWLEKKCYEGVDYIESLRVMKKSVYQTVDGHNEAMVFSEDKDLDLRIRAAGFSVGRTQNFVHHNEGNLKLSRTIRKKLFYTETANLFRETHPKTFNKRANVFNRYGLLLKNIKYFFKHPFVYLSTWFMLTCEFGAGFLRYVSLKLGIGKNA